MFQYFFRYKGDKEVRRGAKFDFSRSGNSAVLIVKDSEPSDAATYRCEAVNKIGRVDTQARLKVHSKLNDCCFLIKVLSFKVGSSFVTER